MDKDDKDNYRVQASQPSDLLPSGYSQDYVMNNPPPQSHIYLDKLNFTDAMHFADYGTKVALNQSDISNENYYPRFDALSDSLQEEPLIAPPPTLTAALEEDGDGEGEARFSENTSSMQFLGNVQKAGTTETAKNRRKRPRSLKTSDEVESQRKTHIAVERNRRRQMNEHLRMLRSLMPGSYVQRGDQASIIGGAIEFVRELEQLLMCLESQKRRRLSSGAVDPPNATVDQPPLPIYQPYFPLPLQDGDQVKLLDFDPSGLSREEIAENKSCIADIEVRLLGFDAMIKIMSRRRPGQLLKTITALEDLGFNILHTNITTMDQTVLYSFNVKITGETIWTAEDIANSIRQILSFIDASTI